VGARYGVDFLRQLPRRLPDYFFSSPDKGVYFRLLLEFIVSALTLRLYAFLLFVIAFAGFPCSVVKAAAPTVGAITLSPTSFAAVGGNLKVVTTVSGGTGGISSVTAQLFVDGNGYVNPLTGGYAIINLTGSGTTYTGTFGTSTDANSPGNEAGDVVPPPGVVAHNWTVVVTANDSTGAQGTRTSAAVAQSPVTLNTLTLSPSNIGIP